MEVFSWRAINNAAQVLAIELLCASQELDLRAPLESSLAIGAFNKLVRESIPILIDDHILANDTAAAAHLISSEEVVGGALGLDRGEDHTNKKQNWILLSISIFAIDNTNTSSQRKKVKL